MASKNSATLAKILSRCDVPRGTVGKLTALHEKHALPLLRKDPYGLLQSVGVSLDAADKVACVLRLSLEKRALGYATWLLNSKSMNLAMLGARLQFALESPSTTIRTTLAKLLKEEKLMQVDSQVMSVLFYHKNLDVVNEVRRRIRAGNTKSKFTIPESTMMNLTTEQQTAVTNATQWKLSIITGGPGGGKSHVVRELMACVPNAKVTAPTGRAARNASGKTVHYFKTIQETGKSEFHGVELVIVDEASMLSVDLFAAVLEMTPKDAHIVLVGDVDQLPPIDSGDVLRDLIDSGIVPIAWLSLNIRSSNEIQHFARGVLEGKVDFLRNDGDVQIIECESFEDVLNAIPSLGMYVGDPMCRLCTHSLNLDRYAILTPHNATRITINKTVQLVVWWTLDEELDITLVKDFPDAPRGTKGIAQLEGSMVKVSADGYTEFRVTLAAAEKLISLDNRSGDCLVTEAGCVVLPGDRVIVTKNTTTACNGDMGIYKAERKVVIRDDVLDIPAISETDPGLTLAYAVTVHKAQGSEFDAVVLPVTNVNAWDRTLLYTAITRAKNKVFLMGSVADVQAIVNTVRPPRVSLLKTLLNALL